MNIMKLITLALASLLATTALAAEHDRNGEHAHDAGAIELTPAQIRAAGIRIDAVRLRALPRIIKAPGKVRFNAYAMADVASRFEAVVHARHARLGDRVRKGSPLLTLESTALAKAQADYLSARAEWLRAEQERNRLRQLAEQRIVSLARLQQAESAFQSASAALEAARATLAAFGLSQRRIKSLARSGKYGLLTIKAPIAGTIVRDDFRLGQHVAAGALLMQIADESSAWVEASVPENALADIRIGSPARILAGPASHKGKVIAIHHRLDPATRTATVRIEADNADEQLHPGMFVQAEINAGAGEKALVVPSPAIQRQGGEHIVFVEREPGHFERREVRPGASAMGWTVIETGLKPGERIVTEGAFALTSELAKGGFDAHQH